MHTAPGLVCSDWPEGCLLSCFDPSATQTVLRFASEGWAWQYRVLPFGLSLSARVFTKIAEGALAPLREVGIRILNCLEHGPHTRTVMRSQGPGASAPQPVGASGQLGKEQALPCAENLFSRCGVRLGEYDGPPHGRARPVSAELPEFLRRQDCGPTETVSEAPGAYGIRSRGHAARIASYETTSALVTLPSPEVGMAPRCTSGEHHTGVSPLLQPLDRPCLSTGRGALRTSVSACCRHNRCLQHGLGRYMQRAGSLGALDGASTALAHQLPRAAGSASSLAAVSATAVRQACVGPYGQHCGCVVYQASGSMQVCITTVSLLAQTLCKVREDEEQVLLVAPFWPTRTWFPELILLATAPPWPIPLRKDFLSQGLGTIWHPRPDLWNLHVWLLDGTRQTWVVSHRRW